MLGRVEIYDSQSTRASPYEVVDLRDYDSNSIDSGEVCPSLPILLRSFETMMENPSEKKDYESILDGIIHGLLSITNSELGTVFLYKKGRSIDEGSFICLSLSERTPGMMFAGQDPRKFVAKSTDGICGYVMKNMTTVISDNVLLDPRTKVKDKFPENHPVIKEFLGIPLVVKGTFLGVLALGNTVPPNNYSIKLLKQIEEVVAVISLIVNQINHEKQNVSSDVQMASSADALKERFLVTMSHEIRTPLNGIMGMVTMLGDAGPLNAKQNEYVRNLTECVFQLTNLMNNILDFSKMTSNKFYLLKQPFKLHEVISDAVCMIEGGALIKGIEIKQKIPPEHAVPTLIGDPQRIIQVLNNLLGNAIKFTEKGHISLTVRTSPVSPEEGHTGKQINIMFDVEDTGVGIPADEQSKIFEVFHQASSLSTYMSRAGTGLGLSIARELVRLMGGRITVRSDGIKGKGSVFSFNIVLDEEINVNSLSKDNAAIFEGAKILVVDDRSENRLMLTEMTLKWGCIPFVVSSAEEGLRYIECGMDIDLVLLDICMPYMSGVEMAQELRQRRPNIPLIGLSSIDIDTGEEYFDYYMYKPLNQNQLFPVMLECLKRRCESDNNDCGDFPLIKSTTLKRKKRSKRRLRILVAEDDNKNTYTIREMLNNLGYMRCDFVADGKACVEQNRAKTYDVILMDIVMPVMDGIEATRHIRTTPNPPYIIAVSAAVQNSDKERCQHAGINSYLAKPLTKEKLDAALAPLVKSKSSKKSSSKHKK